jgi:anti-sigma B factor antagonist
MPAIPSPTKKEDGRHPEEVTMNAILSPTDGALLAPAGELHELVRGQERELVERLTPQVRRQSVTLDLARVERIDAAGIAALISLYGAAHAAGNEFMIVNACTRVAEILALVGLDRILISEDVVRSAPKAIAGPQAEPCFAQPAA